jgi:hypothetical protein
MAFRVHIVAYDFLPARKVINWSHALYVDMNIIYRALISEAGSRSPQHALGTFQNSVFSSTITSLLILITLVHFTTSTYLWISVTPLTTFGQHNLKVWYIKANTVIPTLLFGRFNDPMCRKGNHVSTYTVDLKQIDLSTFNTMLEVQ